MKQWKLKFSGVNDGSVAQALYGLEASFFFLRTVILDFLRSQ